MAVKQTCIARAGIVGVKKVHKCNYIIIGGGSAGCVLANRLSENPKIRVVLLEAGPADNSVWIDIPAGFTRLLKDKRYNWGFRSAPNPALYGRSLAIPRGKGLGGSGSINGMVYVRGSSDDYNRWSDGDNIGWSNNDVLPALKRLENWDGPPNQARGTTGPLRVSEGKERHPLCDAFIASAQEAGYPTNSDYNSHGLEGFSYFQVNTREGRRHSPARAFLDPIKSRNNLHIETNAFVTRTVVDNNAAQSVEYIKDNILHSIEVENEVILCAGTIMSPLILERSGIGQTSRLKALGIDIVHELPGVGENYQDHVGPRMSWRVKSCGTLNERARGLRLLSELARYSVSRTGLLASTAGVVTGFIRTNSALDSPDIQFHMMHASFESAEVRKLEREPGLTVTVNRCHPESRGSVHLSGLATNCPPVIDTNFFSNTEDIIATLRGMKVARKIISMSPLKQYILSERRPGMNMSADNELISFVRETAETTYHAVGTCKMGSASDCVVDERLRVKGIDKLRVVDASIMPTIVSGNTHASTLMIAERGAELIDEDYRR